MGKGGTAFRQGLCTSSALYAVSALFPTPLAADGVSVRLGGYSNSLFSAGSINGGTSRDDPADSADYGNTGLWQNTKLQLSGRYQHDNAMHMGVSVELEIFASEDDDIFTVQQRFAWIESPVGRLELGSNYSAAYQMHYAAPVVGLPLNSGWVTVFIPPNPDSTVVFISPATSTYLDFGDTENVVTYYTPRMEGFQLGISYAPTVSSLGGGQNFPVESDRDLQYSNGLSFGLNFVEKLGAFDVALATGYRRAEASKEVRDLGGRAYQALSFGLNLGYGGVTIGGSYANELEGERAFDEHGVLTSTTGQAWDAGISYETGNWLVGASYFHGQVQGAPPGTDGIIGSDRKSKMTAATVGYDYRIVSGIHAIGGIMYGRWDAESGAVNTGVIAASGLTFYY